MRISEKELLEYLNRILSEQVIYADQYIQKSAEVHYKIYKCAKVEHMSSVKWLISRGFRWKETGYVEPDMQYRQADSVQAMNVSPAIR